MTGHDLWILVIIAGLVLLATGRRLLVNPGQRAARRRDKPTLAEQGKAQQASAPLEPPLEPLPEPSRVPEWLVKWSTPAGEWPTADEAGKHAAQHFNPPDHRPAYWREAVNGHRDNAALVESMFTRAQASQVKALTSGQPPGETRAEGNGHG